MCLSGVAGTITLCVVVHELRILVKEIKMTFFLYRCLILLGTQKITLFDELK